MDKVKAWPLNANAVGAVFSMGYIFFFGDNIRSAALGGCLCLIWCTTQICQSIHDR